MQGKKQITMKTNLSRILLVLLAAILLASGQVDLEDVTDLDLDDTDELDQILDALETENVESSIVTNGEDIASDEDCDAAAADEMPLAGESNPIVAEEPTVQQEQVDDESVTPNEPANTDIAETNNETNTSETEEIAEQQQPPTQTGPFIDIFGDVLLSLEMV